MTRPVVIESIAGIRAAVAGRQVALVPTMGALHEGHLALVERAAHLCETVVVSVFVNPLQFGDPQDLERYPRTLDSDADRLSDHGVQFVFAPAVDEMYPQGEIQTRVTAGRAGEVLEGASRPGHFDGVLTVVSKLLNIVQPDVVTFGRKDAQQAFLVRRMVRELDFPVEVELVETVRADDGLALSSRNRFLSADERRAALALPAALQAAASSGADGVEAAHAAARSVLEREALVAPDYFTLVDPESFEPVSGGFRGEALALVAARVGGVRLIDNAPVRLV